MGVNKVEINENGQIRTLIDLTNDTVTPETLAKDVIAHDAAGNKIVGTMQEGGSTPTTPATPLDPVQVYNDTRPSDWLPMPMPNDNEMYLLFHIPNGCSSLLAFTVVCTGNYTVELGTVSNGTFVQSSSESIASNSKYEIELFADDYGDLTSDRMKQVMVKISGTAITSWTPSTHSKKTSPTKFAGWNIIEISCKLPNCSKVQCGNNSSNLSLKNLRYFSWYGENACTNMSHMFTGCYSLTSIPELNTQKVTNMSYMFSNCYSLISIPALDTQKVISMNYMFGNCRILASIPELNTQKVTNMSNMFYYCYSLTSVSALNTQNVTNMSYMFAMCHSLTSVPALNTQKVTNMKNMFGNCDTLTSIPELDTQNVTDMGYIFNGCFSLTSIPALNTQKVTDMTYMFSYTPIKSIPELDTQNVTNMSYMFSNCYSLTSIPELNTQKVTNMSYMFSNCYSLISIPALNTQKVTSMSSMFNNCYSLTSILLVSTITGWSGQAISIKDCSMTHDAIIAFFNSLPTITSSKAITLTGNPGVKELTTTEKAIATGKRWTLTL